MRHNNAKRHKIAEHSAMLAFLRSCAVGEDVAEYARVIGENTHQCIVEVGYGVARPNNRRFFSVPDDAAQASEIPFEEARDKWGVRYER